MKHIKQNTLKMLLSRDLDSQQLGINLFEQETGLEFGGLGWGSDRGNVDPSNYFVLGFDKLSRRPIFFDTKIRAEN